MDRIEEAKALGIKETLEWVKNNSYYMEIDICHDKGVLGRRVQAINYTKWQTKLKKEGIE